MGASSDPADRFTRLKNAFLELRDLPPDRRALHLDELGRSDPDLRSEIDALVNESSASLDLNQFLDGDDLAALLRTLPAPGRGGPRRIGPYLVTGILGEGGMGTVYRALQLEPIRREVALKMAHPGLDARQVLSRFESERQVLALMDHSHIAKVLDAGSDEAGTPYFVMELVAGVPITDYARKAALGMRERLGLFRTVCRAAHHAHVKGIVHRDLKPSNILVSTQDGAPVIKVIDFGIAKAVDVQGSGQITTQGGRLVGTLQYMSPEQARGTAGAVDTRSDVYSLGMILYELLTDAFPYDVRGLPIPEAIRRIETVPPRKLRGAGPRAQRLDADLETITAKALEKDPERRYAGAAELADDVDRFLGSQPILARPPSATYQLRKLAARHKAGVGMAAALAVILFAFGVVSSVQLQAQRRERARAEEETRKATRVIGFLQDMLASANPGVKNRDARVRDLLDDAARQADYSLAGDPELEASVRRTIGNTYLSLALYDKASEQLRRALELRRQRKTDPELLAESMSDLVGLYCSGEVTAERANVADSLCRESLRLRTRRWGVEHPKVAASLYQLAEIRRLQYRFAEAESLHTRALAIREKTLRQDDPELAQSLSALAGFGPPEESEKRMRRALALIRSLHPGDHPDVASFTRKLGEIIGAKGGQSGQADSLLRESADMERRIWGPRHPRVAEAFSSLALNYVDDSRFAEAESLLRAALGIQLDFHGQESAPAAGAWNDLGYLYWRTGKLEQARQAYGQAITIWRRKLPGSLELALGLNNRAMILGDLGREQEAVRDYGESGELLEKIWGPVHSHVAMVHNNLGVFLINRGRYAEAEPHARKALAIFRQMGGEEHPNTATAWNNLGQVLLGLDRVGEADSVFRRSVAIFSKADPKSSWTTNHLIACHGFGQCLYYEGRLPEALKVLREAEARFRRSPGIQVPDYLPLLVDYGSVLLDSGDLPAAESALRRSLALGKTVEEVFPRWASWGRNALAACLAARGQTAAADSLFRLSSPRAWADAAIPPPARRIARARSLRFYRSLGRSSTVPRVRPARS